MWNREMLPTLPPLLWRAGGSHMESHTYEARKIGEISWVKSPSAESEKTSMIGTDFIGKERAGVCYTMGIQASCMLTKICNHTSYILVLW